VTFHRYGASAKFPRNEHVEIHVRKVDLNADAPSQAVPCVEIREYIKSGEVYGHGIVLPAALIKDLKIALDRVIQDEGPA
jgi:hypothetical protein